MASENSTSPLVDLAFVAGLARTNMAHIGEISTRGLGEGLPAEIPVHFDALTGKPLSVRALVEEYRTKPRAKTGTAKALTLESFIDLVERHKTPASVVFANTSWRAPSFLAVIDYHPPGGTATDNGKHRILYDFPLSDEWKAWVGVNGKTLDQAEFAAWIEEHIAELSTPLDAERADMEATFQTKIATPAELMTLSRGLQVAVEAKVTKSVTLQNGVGQLTFEETHKDAAGNVLTVPGLFILSVAPFDGGARVRIPVRLRYRVAGSSIKWIFALYRPEFFVGERVIKDLDEVGTRTALPTFEGSPEA